MLSVVPFAIAQEDRVVLIVGLTQNWDTLNPNAGYLVSEWEVWTLQYSGLTSVDLDLETAPDLAESWESSADGLTWTYTLREGLLWSDDTPITAEDIAWNINTSVEQEWWNHIETTENLTAVATDDRTVVITSSVPDPSLPSLGIIIFPKHIWEPIATDADAVATYDALDGVGSGPYVLQEYRPSQSVTMIANPNWWGWEGREPGVDEIVFRYFGNSDAMVSALERGEIDAAAGVPGASVDRLMANSDIEVVPGFQGGWEQIGINGGMGLMEPHPAMMDVEVRRAMAYGVDTQAIVEDLWYGFGEEIHVINPSINPKWTPEVSENVRFDYNPATANEILDNAGYMDTNNDGVREMPDGTNPLRIRHIVNTNTDLGQSIGELFAGWMADIGIEVELIALDSDQTGEVIAEGDYDTFNWGWVPGINPSGMISVFISDEIGAWNDANWYDDRLDMLYESQRVELDEAARISQVHEAVNILAEAVIYIGMVAGAELHAYRTDRFEGWVRQPSEDGSIMFSSSSPSYALLQPVGVEPAPTTTVPGTETTTPGTTAPSPGTTAPAGDDGVNWLLVGGIGAVVAAGTALMVARRRSEDERE
jgi:peptide/nickel transport system substrate-binding protein